MMMTMMKILLLKSIKEMQDKQLLLRCCHNHSDHDYDNPPRDPADIMQRAGVIMLYICRSEEGDGDAVREQI